MNNSRQPPPHLHMVLGFLTRQESALVTTWLGLPIKMATVLLKLYYCWEVPMAAGVSDSFSDNFVETGNHVACSWNQLKLSVVRTVGVLYLHLPVLSPSGHSPSIWTLPFRQTLNLHLATSQSIRQFHYPSDHSPSIWPPPIWPFPIHLTPTHLTIPHPSDHLPSIWTLTGSWQVKICNKSGVFDTTPGGVPPRGQSGLYFLYHVRGLVTAPQLRPRRRAHLREILARLTPHRGE